MKKFSASNVNWPATLGLLGKGVGTGAAMFGIPYGLYQVLQWALSDEDDETKARLPKQVVVKVPTKKKKEEQLKEAAAPVSTPGTDITGMILGGAGTVTGAMLAHYLINRAVENAYESKIKSRLRKLEKGFVPKEASFAPVSGGDKKEWIKSFLEKCSQETGVSLPTTLKFFLKSMPFMYGSLLALGGFGAYHALKNMLTPPEEPLSQIPPKLVFEPEEIEEPEDEEKSLYG